MFKYIADINPLKNRKNRIFPFINVPIHNLSPQQSPSPQQSSSSSSPSSPSPLPEDSSDEGLDALGTYDKKLYDIVKDIREPIILTKEQIKYLQSISRNNLIKVIKLLNFSNVIFNHQLIGFIDNESVQQQIMNATQKTLDERQLAQDRRQMAQDRRQMAQDRRQMAQDRRQKFKTIVN
jgi:hypothetical protein